MWLAHSWWGVTIKQLTSRPHASPLTSRYRCRKRKYDCLMSSQAWKSDETSWGNEAASNMPMNFASNWPHPVVTNSVRSCGGIPSFVSVTHKSRITKRFEKFLQRTCDSVVRHSGHSEGERWRKQQEGHWWLSFVQPRLSSNLAHVWTEPAPPRDCSSEVEAGTRVPLRSQVAATQPTVFTLSWGSLPWVGAGVDRWKHAAPGISEMCWIAPDKKQLSSWSQLFGEKHNPQPWKMESIIKVRQEKFSWPNKQWHWILRFLRLRLNSNGIVSDLL